MSVYVPCDATTLKLELHLFVGNSDVFYIKIVFYKLFLLHTNAVQIFLVYRRIKGYCIVLYCTVLYGIVHQLTPEERRRRGTDIGRAYRRYVKEDHSPWVMTGRKQLLPRMREAQERWKVAYICLDKLVAKDKLAGSTQPNTTD